MVVFEPSIYSWWVPWVFAIAHCCASMYLGGWYWTSEKYMLAQLAFKCVLIIHYNIMNYQHTFIQFIYYRVTPQNVGCIIETVLHMIIELLSLLVRVISWFSVSPPWSLTLLICIFISSYVLSSYKKTTPFKLLWTLENCWTLWEIHFRTVTLTIITITIIIVIVMPIIN